MARIAPSVWIATLMVGGCAHQGVSELERLQSALRPVVLGVDQDTLKKELGTYASIWVMTSPGSLDPGGQIARGRNADVLFGFKGGLVTYVSTTDPELRTLRGCHVGSTYSEVRTAYPHAELRDYPGYGRLVEIAPNVHLAFLWSEQPITADDRVHWIEMTR